MANLFMALSLCGYISIQAFAQPLESNPNHYQPVYQEALQQIGQQQQQQSTPPPYQFDNQVIPSANVPEFEPQPPLSKDAGVHKGKAGLAIQALREYIKNAPEYVKDPVLNLKKKNKSRKDYLTYHRNQVFAMMNDAVTGISAAFIASNRAAEISPKSELMQIPAYKALQTAPVIVFDGSDMIPGHCEFTDRYRELTQSYWGYDIVQKMHCGWTSERCCQDSSCCCAYFWTCGLYSVPVCVGGLLFTALQGLTLCGSACNLCHYVPTSRNASTGMYDLHEFSMAMIPILTSFANNCDDLLKML